jgi:hypothetical protein
MKVYSGKTESKTGVREIVAFYSSKKNEYVYFHNNELRSVLRPDAAEKIFSSVYNGTKDLNYKKEEIELDNSWNKISVSEFFEVFEELEETKRKEDSAKERWFCLLPIALDDSDPNMDLIKKVGGIYFYFDGLFAKTELRPDHGISKLICERETNDSDMSSFDVYDLENMERVEGAKEITREQFEEAMANALKIIQDTTV